MLLGSAAGFRTDTDISGNLAVRERELQRWEPSTESDVDLSLESSGGVWDQFEANEKRFGLKTDYDENLYTTRIDKSSPSYRMREAEASRIAREIEGDIATNSHMREERGTNQDDDGLDEEERFVPWLHFIPIHLSNNRVGIVVSDVTGRIIRLSDRINRLNILLQLGEHPSTKRMSLELPSTQP